MQSETKLFFCDPNSPYQKSHVENNHTLFRGIAQNGTSFDDWTQENVNLIFSHINAVKRKQFNGKSAYDMIDLDKWKEDFLLELKEKSVQTVTFVDDNNYKIWGYHFFNTECRSVEFNEDVKTL